MTAVGRVGGVLAAAAAGFVAGFALTAGAASPEVQLLDQSYAAFKQSNLYAKWARSNPVESGRVDAYWLNGGDVPTVATPFGRGLVLEGQARWALASTTGTTTTQPPPTPTLTPTPSPTPTVTATPEPAPGPELRWPRPATSETVRIPTVGPRDIVLEPGKDYLLEVEGRLRQGGLKITGGRNVVLVGVEQTLNAPAWTGSYEGHQLLAFYGQTGTIHLEGYYGHGTGVCCGINVWAPQAVLQVQNSRIEGVKRIHSDAEPEHPDIFQGYDGPRETRFWNFSGSTDYQGLLPMMNYTLGVPTRLVFDRVNLWPTPLYENGNGSNPGFLWLVDKQIEALIGEVWVEAGHYQGWYKVGLKDSLGYRNPSETAPLWAWQEFRADGTPYGPEHYQQPANTGESQTKSQGDYLVFTRPAEDNIWTLDKTGQARVFQGRPLAGDFAPAGRVGRSYPG